MLAVVLGLGSSIAWGVSDFLGGIKSRRLEVLSVLLLSQAVGLSAIAAVVVGGTLLTGGMGSVATTFVGVLLLGLVFNILNFENGQGVFSLSAYWQSVIRGAFLLVVVVLQARLLNRARAG